MPPQPLALYRRRWTQWFTVPFVAVMAACTVFAIFQAVALDDRLFTAVFSLSAFCTFCLAWTLGNSALEAHRNREPAVVIDHTGITDLRQEDPQPIPWSAIERVRLDEDRIVVRLRTAETTSALQVVSQALQRWQRGGDLVVALDGLGHNPYKLQQALAAFHKAPTSLTKPRQ